MLTTLALKKIKKIKKKLQAFDEAMKDMDSVKLASFKDSSLIMQLLRDNLTVS